MRECDEALKAGMITERCHYRVVINDSSFVHFPEGAFSELREYLDILVTYPVDVI